MRKQIANSDVYKTPPRKHGGEKKRSSSSSSSSLGGKKIVGIHSFNKQAPLNSAYSSEVVVIELAQYVSRLCFICCCLLLWLYMFTSVLLFAGIVV